MSHQIEIRRTRSTGFFRDGVITGVALLLTFAAFDDITTDNATTFLVEYSMLFACGAWLAFVALRLLRTGRPLVGGLSATAILMAVWALRAIGPGVVPGFWLEYVVISGAYLWFWCVSAMLLWLGWRDHRGSHRTV
jgi:hypothetical protein